MPGKSSQKSPDVRLNPFVMSVRSEEAPQPHYSALAGTRLERADGMVNLFTLEDITTVNRHPGVLGMGGGGNVLGNTRPLIPLEIDGEEHAKWRRLLDPLFGPKKMAALSDTIRLRANELIDGFLDAGEVELFTQFCVPLPSSIFLGLLGAPVADLELFLAFKDGVTSPNGATTKEIAANAALAGAKMYDYFAALLAERRAAPPSDDDLIGALLQAEVDGELMDDEVLVDILYLLMLAGLDTVTGSLSCIFARFARHPDERAQVTENPDLLRPAIEEMLRFETPVHSGVRFATQDIDLGGGETIRSGEVIHAMWAAANLDPQAFPDPLSVDLTRRRNAHIAFGSGVHRCLGSHFARLELRIAVEEFHRRVGSYSFAPGQEARYHNIAVRSVRTLPLRLVPAQAAAGPG